jgi:hypothetical protein
MKYLETNCRICGKPFSSFQGLHLHLKKSENVTKQEYYSKHFPKYCISTGRQLIFESPESYESSRFFNLEEECKYILKNGINKTAKEVLSDKLLNIKEKSNKFPSFIEWASYGFLDYKKLWESNLLFDFLSLAKSLNFEKNKIYSSTPEILPNVKCELLVDTREQKPLFKTPQTSINIGDYTFPKDFYNAVHVDRKSQGDFISTFTSGLERFRLECIKAQKLDITLVVLVEDSFSDCLNFKPKEYHKFQKADGKYAFRGVRKIMREFGVQFLFVKNREEAREYVYKILSNPEIISKYDLQYLYNLNKI